MTALVDLSLIQELVQKHDDCPFLNGMNFSVYFVKPCLISLGFTCTIKDKELFDNKHSKCTNSPGVQNGCAMWKNGRKILDEAKEGD